MKICLVAHGYPPELVGGTEKAVQGLAHGLARRGHEVVVVAGSMQFEGGFRVSTDSDRDPASGATIQVRRIHRADLYFDHWQKSASARVAGAFETWRRYAHGHQGAMKAQMERVMAKDGLSKDMAEIVGRILKA